MGRAEKRSRRLTSSRRVRRHCRIAASFALVITRPPSPPPPRGSVAHRCRCLVRASRVREKERERERVRINPTIRLIVKGINRVVIVRKDSEYKEQRESDTPILTACMLPSCCCDIPPSRNLPHCHVRRLRQLEPRIAGSLAAQYSNNNSNSIVASLSLPYMVIVLVAVLRPSRGYSAYSIQLLPPVTCACDKRNSH